MIPVWEPREEKMVLIFCLKTPGESHPDPEEENSKKRLHYRKSCASRGGGGDSAIEMTGVVVVPFRG